MLDDFIELLATVTTPTCASLETILDSDFLTELSTAAAKTIHHAWEGLLEHTLEVMHYRCQVCEIQGRGLTGPAPTGAALRYR